MSTNEYEDGSCPECDGSINDFGFCEDCSFDYEENLLKTEGDWPKTRKQKNEDKNSTGTGTANASEDGKDGD